MKRLARSLLPLMLAIIALACGGKIEGEPDDSEAACLKLPAAEACSRKACRQLIVSSCAGGRCTLASGREWCTLTRPGNTCPEGEWCTSISVDACSFNPDDDDAPKLEFCWSLAALPSRR